MTEDWQRINIEAGLGRTLNIAVLEFTSQVEVVKEFGRVPEIECLPSQLNRHRQTKQAAVHKALRHARGMLRVVRKQRHTAAMASL